MPREIGASISMDERSKKRVRTDPGAVPMITRLASTSVVKAARFERD
jgi:hypothetical protein